MQQYWPYGYVYQGGYSTPYLPYLSFPSVNHNYLPLLNFPNSEAYRMGLQNQNLDSTQRFSQNLAINHMENKERKKLYKAKTSTAVVKAEENVKKQQKSTKYQKKNAQSNSMNQIFSFMITPSKSWTWVSKFLGGDRSKIQAYYILMQQVKKKTKKYVNRYYLKRLIEFQSNHQIHILYNKSSMDTLPIQELKLVLRMLIIYYIKHIYISTVLTSKRLDKQSIMEHLKRRREVQQFLTYHIRLSNNNRKPET